MIDWEELAGYDQLVDFPERSLEPILSEETVAAELSGSDCRQSDRSADHTMTHLRP
jgi:hypothetical protein